MAIGAASQDDGDRVMTKVRKIVQEKFAQIDDDLSNYIFTILSENRDNFEDVEDIFESVGEILVSISDGLLDEAQVKEICLQILVTLKGSEATSNVQNGQRILSAPIHLGEMVSTMSDNIDSYRSIWIQSKEMPTQVDQKKLEKAEAKLRIKQERRDNFDTSSNSTPVQYVPQQATTAQMIGRKDTRNEEGSRNRDIKLENFDISYGSNLLLKSANLNMTFGRRYGVVGRNGIGKSTFLKMISSGSLYLPKHVTILHVEQEVVGDETTALEAVLECDTVRSSLLAEEKALLLLKDSDTSKRLEEVYNELNAIEADKAPARAAMILNGLGFNPTMQSKATKEFSGGWRMRIALARALFSQPDLLLLDEPTNMLDMKAIIWLETYLVENWKSTLLVVSHDKQFLDIVPTDILHFHSQQIDSYPGSYQNFIKARADKLKNQEREYEAQFEHRKHIQQFIDKFRYNASKASLVQSRLKMLERMPELVPIKKDAKVSFSFPDPDELSGAPILQLDEVSFYFTEKDGSVFEKVSINANLESRICIVGDNGSGKTTLLKILIGDLSPVSGERKSHAKLRIGYFSQHHVDQLSMNQNSIEFLASRHPGKPIEFYRTQLGRFGVSGDMGLQPIASLSGGQKSRVAFAAMALAMPQIIILDEPTNHLDIETVEALGNAINAFKGGVIVVSHDESLIKLICKELWYLSNKSVCTLEGGFIEYKKLVEQELLALK